MSQRRGELDVVSDARFAIRKLVLGLPIEKDDMYALLRAEAMWPAASKSGKLRTKFTLDRITYALVYIRENDLVHITH